MDGNQVGEIQEIDQTSDPTFINCLVFKNKKPFTLIDDLSVYLLDGLCHQE